MDKQGAPTAAEKPLTLAQNDKRIMPLRIVLEGSSQSESRETKSNRARCTKS